MIDMKNIIEVHNISKLYHLGEISSSTIVEDFSRLWQRLSGKEQHLGITDNAQTKDNSYWALKNVSFNVQEGEILGIIGKNGAGKSTLLKILSRVTAPTSGSVKIYGRVASLLEVGTGFHPDLSGRENIYQNGAVLGMREGEIKAKFDEIVAFSGVEKFIDTPVKRYSSGMYVRLAFAVAAHLEPEILIVDEVLAVGDADFQKKCLNKMRDVSSGSGRTVLFVSHNLTAIQTLCNRAILLLNGEIESSGDTGKVITHYQNKYNTDLRSNELNVTLQEGVLLQSLELHSQLEETDMFSRNDDIDIITNLKVLSTCEFYIALILRTVNSEVVFETGSKLAVISEGSYSFECKIPPRLLNSNIYTVQINITGRGPKIWYYQQDVLRFEIYETESANDYYGKVSGIIRPELEWNIAKK